MMNTGTSALSSLSTGLADVRTGLAARRARRDDARRLERELAAYSTPAEQAELDAIIARAPAQAAEELDRIVTRLRAA